MGDDPLKEIRLGKVGIEVRRVHVTGDEREQLDVLLRQGSRHARRVADPYLVKRPVLDECLVGHSLIFSRPIARAPRQAAWSPLRARRRPGAPWPRPGGPITPGPPQSNR